jgi:hypothetical protein
MKSTRFENHGFCFAEHTDKHGLDKKQNLEFDFTACDEVACG